MASVWFRAGSFAQYNALKEKDSGTLYFVTDGSQYHVYKGDQLYAVGNTATEAVAGLMSAEDKAALNKLIQGGGIPTYELEKMSEAQTGSLASYRLKKTVGETVTYEGDVINIPKDIMLQGGELKTVENDDVPYSGAKKGDPYLDLVLNDDAASHIYIPVKGLVDFPGAGDGINVVGNIVSIKLDEANAHGLKVGEAGLALDLATETSDGAMSAADKARLNALPAEYLKLRYEVKDTTLNPDVRYNHGEIRICYADNSAWVEQKVGNGGDSSRYYTNLIAYAPEGAVSFKETSDSSATPDFSKVEMEYFDNNASAGTDKYGRNYTNVWLPVAVKESSGWRYFGAGSSDAKYIGWYYGVEWYDAAGKLISSDVVRVSLSNEGCHLNPLPYYMGKYALKTELDTVAGNLEWCKIE